MRPLSATLNDLIALAEEAIVRPQAVRDARFAERFRAVGAEVRRADQQPAAGIRTTNAAMVMVIAIEAASAAEAGQPWRMLAGAALDLLRADAYQELLNQREARG